MKGTSIQCVRENRSQMKSIKKGKVKVKLQKQLSLNEFWQDFKIN